MQKTLNLFELQLHVLGGGASSSSFWPSGHSASITWPRAKSATTKAKRSPPTGKSNCQRGVQMITRQPATREAIRSTIAQIRQPPPASPASIARTTDLHPRCPSWIRPPRPTRSPSHHLRPHQPASRCLAIHQPPTQICLPLARHHLFAAIAIHLG
ncbi:hypothetical protein Dimus_037847 [Dionaea muscipula]